jgi:predicted dehydrogenase
MEPLKIGVIGTGIMGELYIQVYQQDPRTEVVALCNRGEERLNKAGEKYGIATRYTDLDAMLADEALDAVCVATPDFAHFAPTKKCLEAGKHVLCEKPFTTDLAEADALCKLVDETGLKLQVAYSHRWLSVYYRTHTAIDKGEIGEPLMAYARKNDTLWVATDMINWAHQSTPSLFLSGHDIDLVRWYFGSEGVEAHGYGTKKVLVEKGIDTYDIIQAQVKFANGNYATFEAGWVYANTYPTIPDSFLQVVGSKGHISMDRAEESMAMTTEEKYQYPKTFLYGEMFGKVGGAFQGCLSSFIDCIQNDTEPIVTAHDGRQVTAILCAIDEAVRTGKTVSVK